jgi:hypothetical protein
MRSGPLDCMAIFLRLSARCVLPTRPERDTAKQQTGGEMSSEAPGRCR